MKDALSIIPEFFFDVCGIFVPGLALLSAVYWMGLMPLAILPYDNYKAIGIILVSYLAGHLVFSFSQKFVAWFADRTTKPREEFLESNCGFGEMLRSKIASKWCESQKCIQAGRCTRTDSHISPEKRIPHKIAYELCRSYVHIRDNERSAFLRKEQTYGELSRSMVTVCLLCAILVWFSSRPIEVQAGGALVFVVSTALFYLRYKKARHTDAELVYLNFIVLLQEEAEKYEHKHAAKDEARAASYASTGQTASPPAR